MGFVSRSYDAYERTEGDDWSGDEEGFVPVTRLRRQYIDYLYAKALEIEEQKVSRHYYHGSQWTAEEIRVLRRRRQPVVTYNRINRKIDGICGLLEKLRQDPKAFPRNPRNGAGAEVATQAIREVCDRNEWKVLDHDSTERAAMEGIGGIELKLVEGDQHDPDVGMAIVWGEDWFYDPRSRMMDFSDGRYHGIAKWLDIEAAVELFPDKETEIRDALESGFDLTTHADMEYKWFYTNERRVRLVEHWYKNKGKWHWCFYIASLILDQGVSPFLDERGVPMSRFIMFSAAVDHDGDRYGFVRNLKGPQDEINQRRSKALHITNSRRVIMEKGAVDDVETMRREWARPDGIVEINPGFADKVHPDERQEDLASQLEFMNEAKNEIDSFANVNPALLAQGDPTEHSGVAIDLMQRAGLAELSKFVLAHRAWKIRVYRAIWNIVQEHWKAERWIRVTDDQNVVKFIQLNGVDIERNPQSPNFMKPVLVNALGALDMDIILDEGPDVATVMQDAFQLFKDDPTIPASVKLELSPAPQSTKDRITKMIQQAQQQQPPDPKIQAAQIQARTAAQKSQAEVAKAQLSIQTEQASAQREQIQGEQEMAMEREKASMELSVEHEHLVNRRNELAMEAEFKRRQHADRMEELEMKARERGESNGSKTRSTKPPPPVKGARLAPDGHHYLRDPSRPGKYLRVVH